MFGWGKKKKNPEPQMLPAKGFIPECQVFLENPKTGHRIPAPYGYQGKSIYLLEGETWEKVIDMDTPEEARSMAYHMALRLMKSQSRS